MKTVETKESVSSFVQSVDEFQRADVKKLITLVKNITGKKPMLWGSIIGFGNYTYKRKGSSKEYEWFNVGIAPRKNKISLYVTCYLEKEPLAKKLGNVTLGKGCIYIKKLVDINLETLQELITKYKDSSWYN